jgi:hypothetical protein
LEPGEEPDVHYVDMMLEGITKYAFMKRLCGLASTMQKVIVNIKKFPFAQDNY